MNSTVTDSVREPALVLVATPIGNMGDLSPRAVFELTEADLVACEDTRQTGKLYKHLGIPHPPFLVCNEHTEARTSEVIVDRIRSGERVVLVSDAGMPGISDPGERMVSAVVAAGLAVTAVPGASAVLAALAMSGFSTERFVFEGFLPRKGSERSERLAEIEIERRTTIFFESPRRMQRTLNNLLEQFGPDRRIAVARELTKRYEEIWRGRLGDAVDHFGAREPRGEFVVVVEGAQPIPTTDVEILDALRSELAIGASRRDAIDAVVGGFGVGKRRVYELALTLGRD